MKRNKQRLTVAWIFLVMIEILCPVLEGEAGFARGEFPPPSAYLANNFSLNDNNSGPSSDSSFLNHDQSQQQACCNDDCLCHGMAIVGLSLSTERPEFFRSERTPFSAGLAFSNQTSPPYPPPKPS